MDDESLVYIVRVHDELFFVKENGNADRNLLDIVSCRSDHLDVNPYVDDEKWASSENI